MFNCLRKINICKITARPLLYSLIFPILIGCVISCSPRGTSIEKILKNYGKRFNESFVISGYYCESSFLKGELASYTDAMGKLVSLGPDYYIKLNSLVFFPENIRKGGVSQGLNNLILEAVVSHQSDGVFEKTGFAPEYNNLLNAYRRMEESGPLNLKKKAEFVFELMENSQGLPFFLFKSISSDKYGGAMYFDQNTHLIDSIVFDTCPWYCNLGQEFVNGHLVVKFKHQGNKSFPVFIQGGYKFGDFEIKVRFSALDGCRLYNFRITEEFGDMLVTYTKNPLIFYNPELWLDFPYKEACFLKESDWEINRFQNMENSDIEPYYSYTFKGESLPNLASLKVQKQTIEELLSGVMNQP
jgi:hypothetical protein